MTTIIRRTSSDLASMSRAAQRKERLLQIEREQRIEEAEALKMTEEQREILLRSFTSVKVEFSDLDGLKWTHSALRRRQGAPHPKSPVSPTPPNHTFVILTNADLASFSPEDTIRASAARPRPRFPSHYSSPNLSRGSRAGSPANSRSPVKSLFSGASPKLSSRYKESRRASDIELAPSCHTTGYDSDCDRTVRGESDVEDLDYESSGGGAGRGRGRGKRIEKRAKRKVRKSMAGDDGMMDNEDEDDGVWEDIKGEAESLRSRAAEAGHLPEDPTSTAGGNLPVSQLEDTLLLRHTPSPSRSVAIPVTPSKAPAFITYSSPVSRTITSSSSAPSLTYPVPSHARCAPRILLTLPRHSPTADLPRASPALADSTQNSTSPPRLEPTTTLHCSLPPGLSHSQHYSYDAPLPLTRLPHRVRRTRSSSSSSLLPPETQNFSPPLTSLPFPFPSSTVASTLETTPPNLDKPTAPLQIPSERLQASTEAITSLKPGLNPSSTSSLSLLSRPKSSASGILVVRGWNPSERENMYAEETATSPDSLGATAAACTTADETSDKISSLGC
ncbi:hypothetical protein BDZ94DRAFT_1270955 [Collybia nuda]|uniref:Uncharacterized protein n=1 Tax=Collybia nuda TaxID=64659 RepID=A0A9P5XWE4_9AGAR|nr:hypothetical protein BDZ94DRAFT_1270955 [Collybia nuda]